MRELREAIIHLDGSEQNVKNLSLDIAPDIQQIGDDVTRFTLVVWVQCLQYAFDRDKKQLEEFGGVFGEVFIELGGWNTI